MKKDRLNSGRTARPAPPAGRSHETYRPAGKMTIILLFLAAGILYAQNMRPNILFCIADDWGPAEHSSILGDKVVKTPAFDRIAREGVLFTRAHVTVASCTPSRASALAGQMFWRLGTASNLFGSFPKSIPIYTEILKEAGYFVGSHRKGCAPGCSRQGGPAAGQVYDSFTAFINALPTGRPFCFWEGTSDPHRPYDEGSGVKSGMKTADVELPPFWPDAEQIRSDVLDYYYEVERFDSDVGKILDILEDQGKLNNTLIVMAGDHAMPFPRFKSNSYEFSTNVPFAVRWGDSLAKPGRVVDDFVSFQDLAPTFLEAAGVQKPGVMTGKSFLDILKSRNEGRVDPARDHIFFGKNSHTGRAPFLQNYVDEYGHFYAPQRTILTDNYVLVWNMAPDQWPAGPPPAYPDVDVAEQTGGGQTKGYMLDNKNDPTVRPHFEMCFLKRPEYELYDIKNDPWHMENLAEDPDHRDSLELLRGRLERYLCDTDDPEALVDTLGDLDCDTVWTEVFGCTDTAYEEYSADANIHVQDSCKTVGLSVPAFARSHVRWDPVRHELIISGKHRLDLADIRGGNIMTMKDETGRAYRLPASSPGIYIIRGTISGKGVSHRFLTVKH